MISSQASFFKFFFLYLVVIQTIFKLSYLGQRMLNVTCETNANRETLHLHHLASISFWIIQHKH